jgi:hypothetical protein
MEVQQTVACSKHCCCLDAGEYSLFRVSKFQALVQDYYYYYYYYYYHHHHHHHRRRRRRCHHHHGFIHPSLDTICLFSSCIGAVFIPGH